MVNLLEAKEGEVRVRFFCQGLGDCILIAIGNQDGKTTRILVDCGVIVGTPNGASVIREVSEAVAASCGNQLDVLVLTHEHWDHCSAFLDAQDVWEGIDVKQVWTAWTENEQDAFAKDLRAKREAKLAHLTALVSDPTRFLEFLGADAENRAGKTAQAFEWAKKHATHGITYWHPGESVKTANQSELIELPDGVDILFLGPPHNSQITKSDDAGGRHTYRSSALKLDGDNDEGPEEDYLPFEKGYTIPIPLFKPETDDPILVEAIRQFVEQLTASSLHQREISDPVKLEEEISQVVLRHRSSSFTEAREFAIIRDYLNPKHPDSWRKLEDQDAINELALSLDGDTNNTSLAFAIRLGDRDEYLLFPADAQVGNWLSWGDQNYPGTKPGASVTVQEILNKTVLYKVGHHGSHNATLKDKGLELMTHPKLCAFLPLDQSVAETKRWPMPWPSLYETLKHKVQEGDKYRLARSDSKIADPKGFTPSPDRFSDNGRPLYYDWHSDLH